MPKGQKVFRVDRKFFCATLNTLWPLSITYKSGAEYLIALQRPVLVSAHYENMKIFLHPLKMESAPDEKNLGHASAYQ